MAIISLSRFLVKDRIQHLTDEEVNQLRQASRQDDAFAQYGYGRWLYYLNPYQGAMKDAEELFFKTKDVLPDSMAAYALMIRYGETVSTRPSEMDIEEYQKLLLQAKEQGSLLASVQYARDRIYGTFCEAEPIKVTEEIEKLLSENPNSDSFWYLLLAFAYEATNRPEDAEKIYERALELGELDSYFYLANIYQKKGNTALAEEYFEDGCSKGCTMCLLYQSDMDAEEYESLNESTQFQIHQNIDERLRRGLQMGEGYCAYYLWMHYKNGNLGYPKNEDKAFSYLKRGIELGNTFCITQMAIAAQYGGLPENMSLSPCEIGELWLQAARYDIDSEAIIELNEVTDDLFMSKHKNEIKKYWEPRFFELFESEEDSDDKGNNPDEDSWYNPRDDFFDHWKNDDDEDDGRFDAYV